MRADAGAGAGANADATFADDVERLRDAWPRLHLTDAEPLPEDAAELHAWALFHAGRFAEAIEAGRAAGGSGDTAADRAQLACAHHLEPRETLRAALLQEIVERTTERLRLRPDDASAYHLLGVALARRAQGTNIGAALAQGLLGRVASALEAAIALAPRHANAHIALGAFQVDVIDKLGSLIARTQGITKDGALAQLRAALKLDPGSVLARIEYANGLLVLEGDPCLAQAERLYREAADATPRDALEQLQAEMARHALNE